MKLLPENKYSCCYSKKEEKKKTTLKIVVNVKRDVSDSIKLSKIRKKIRIEYLIKSGHDRFFPKYNILLNLEINFFNYLYN